MSTLTFEFVSKVGDLVEGSRPRSLLPGDRVEVVVAFEDLVDFGALAFELLGLFEEGFGRDGD